MRARIVEHDDGGVDVFHPPSHFFHDDEFHPPPPRAAASPFPQSSFSSSTSASHGILKTGPMSSVIDSYICDAVASLDPLPEHMRTRAIYDHVFEYGEPNPIRTVDEKDTRYSVDTSGLDALAAHSGLDTDAVVDELVRPIMEQRLYQTSVVQLDQYHLRGDVAVVHIPMKTGLYRIARSNTFFRIVEHRGKWYVMNIPVLFTDRYLLSCERFHKTRDELAGSLSRHANLHREVVIDAVVVAAIAHSITSTRRYKEQADCARNAVNTFKETYSWQMCGLEQGVEMQPGFSPVTLLLLSTTAFDRYAKARDGTIQNLDLTRPYSPCIVQGTLIQRTQTITGAPSIGIVEIYLESLRRAYYPESECRSMFDKTRSAISRADNLLRTAWPNGECVSDPDATRRLRMMFAASTLLIKSRAQDTQELTLPGSKSTNLEENKDAPGGWVTRNTLRDAVVDTYNYFTRVVRTLALNEGVRHDDIQGRLVNSIVCNALMNAQYHISYAERSMLEEAWFSKRLRCIIVQYAEDNYSLVETKQASRWPMGIDAMRQRSPLDRIPLSVDLSRKYRSLPSDTVPFTEIGRALHWKNVDYPLREATHSQDPYVFLPIRDNDPPYVPRKYNRSRDGDAAADQPGAKRSRGGPVMRDWLDPDQEVDDNYDD